MSNRKLGDRVKGLAANALGSSLDALRLRRAHETEQPVAAAPRTGKPRGRPATGRTAVLHTQITPAYKEKLFQLAQQRHGISSGVLIEQMVDELEQLSAEVADLRVRLGMRAAFRRREPKQATSKGEEGVSSETPAGEAGV